MRTALLLLALPVGCNQPKDSGEPDDTGEPQEAVGCITVNGDGAYLHLDDAISAANPGDTVVICDQILRESVTVDKDLTLEGTTLTGTYWLPPVNEPAVRVLEGASLTVRNLTVSASRTAFEVERATLSLRNLDVADAGADAVRGEDAAVALDGVHFGITPTGAVRLTGGSLQMSGSTVDGAKGYGVYLEDVTAVLTDTVIGNTFFTGDGSSIHDGWGIDASGGSLSLQGVTLENNILGGIHVVGGSLTAENVEIRGSILGVWLETGSAELSKMEVSDYSQYGVVAISSEIHSLDDFVIQTSRTESLDHTEEHEGSYGIVGVDSSVSASNGLISGNNSAGVYLTPQNSTRSALDLHTVIIEDNARFGVVNFLGTMALTDVTVRRTEDHPSCVADTGYSCNMAVAAWQSDAVIRGGEIEDNGMFGLVALAGSADAEGLVLRRNRDFGAFFQDSAYQLTDVEWAQGRRFGLYSYGSIGSLTRPHFHDATDVASYSWDNGDGTVTTATYLYQATEIYASDSVLELEGGIFERGEEGITADNSAVEVTDTRFSGYNRHPLGVYGSAGDLSLRRVELEEIGGYGVYCSGGHATLDQVSARDFSEVKDGYQVFLDEVLQSEVLTAAPAPVIAAWNCTLTIEDVDVLRARDAALETVNTALAVDGLRALEVCAAPCETAGIEMTWTGVPPDAWLSDVSLDTIGGNGLHAAADPAYPGNLSWSDVSILSTDGSGALIQQLGALVLTGGEVSASAGDGVRVEGGVTELRDWHVNDSGQRGISGLHAALTMDSVTVHNSVGSSLYLEGGSASLRGCTLHSISGWGAECEEEAVLSADSESTWVGGGGDLSCPIAEDTGE